MLSSGERIGVDAKGFLRPVNRIVRILVAVAEHVRIAEIVAHAEVQLITADQEGHAAAAGQSVAPAVVAGQLVGVVPAPGRIALLASLLVLVAGREGVGEGCGRLEVDPHVVAQHVDVRLPDDRKHHRVHVARVVEVVFLLLDRRGVRSEREALLQEFEVYTEASDEALLAVVAPRQAAAVHAPHPAHFLFGIEPPGAHAVAGRETERMLRRGTRCGQHTEKHRHRDEKSPYVAFRHILI